MVRSERASQPCQLLPPEKDKVPEATVIEHKGVGRARSRGPRLLKLAFENALGHDLQCHVTELVLALVNIHHGLSLVILAQRPGLSCFSPGGEGGGGTLTLEHDAV